MTVAFLCFVEGFLDRSPKYGYLFSYFYGMLPVSFSLLFFHLFASCVIGFPSAWDEVVRCIFDLLV